MILPSSAAWGDDPLVFTPRRNFTANEYPELFRMARAQLYKPGDPRLGLFLDPPALDAAVVDNGSESSADGAGGAIANDSSSSSSSSSSSTCSSSSWHVVVVSTW